MGFSSDTDILKLCIVLHLSDLVICSKCFFYNRSVGLYFSSGVVKEDEIQYIPPSDTLFTLSRMSDFEE